MFIIVIKAIVAEYPYLFFLCKYGANRREKDSPPVGIKKKERVENPTFLR
jgi:hypothetical protein